MNKPAWIYFLRFYRGFFRPLFLSVTLSIGQSLLVLPVALIVRTIFDSIIPSSDIHLLIYACGAIFLLNLANTGLTLLTRSITLKTNKRVIQRLREDLLTRCYSFSRSFYTEADRSRIHAAIVQDSERLDWMANALVALFLPSLVICIGLAGVLLYLNVTLFLVLMAVIPFLYLVGRTLRKGLKSRTQAFHRAFEAFSKGMLFVLQMLDLTKIQTAESSEIQRQRKNMEKVCKTSTDMAWFSAAHTTVQTTILTISGLLILAVGGAAVASGSMSLGSLLSFYVAVALLNRYTQTLISSIPHIIAGNESLHTLYRMVSKRDVIPYGGKEKISFRGKITLQEVQFAYKDEPILRDITLKIEPSSWIALTGPNGSGKSTIAHLILGFYRPQAGRIFADDHSYNDLDIIHHRRQIGVVSQNPILFPGTVRENIIYGRPETSMEQIVEAAELAMAHEFITALPQGYDTETGERGDLLSGGQVQRIAIARALLRRPRLLILDEPFNYLDQDTVGQLVRNFRILDGRPTILMMTHDLQIIRKANVVYVLQEGRIVQSDSLQCVPQERTRPKPSIHNNEPMS